MMSYTVTEHIDPEAVAAGDFDRVAIVTDSNVARLYPSLTEGAIIIPAGEENKTVETASAVWRGMSERGLTRHSLLVNIGGGMVTDLGAFCASTYMRGIEFVNVSTTLLGAVDASIGGKTGVDLGGLKNRIGTFAEPRHTYIATSLLATLPDREWLSGFGEMVKTGYISSPTLTAELLAIDPREADTALLTRLIEACLEVKAGVVARDPREHGERKTLNFGHTAGHAFETLALRRGRPMAHGIAVAHGILTALILSHTQLGMPSREIYRYADFLNYRFPPMRVTCDDYEELWRLMTADKKNRADGKTRWCLLREVGEAVPEVTVEKNEVESAIDIYRDLTRQ